MQSIFPIATLLVAALCGSIEALNCNGMSGLCDLKFNEVTLPCTHNSAANRVMYYYDSPTRTSWAAGSCWYRNQGMDFKGQLNFGIRFFDIDTKAKRGTPYVSHSNALGKTLDHEINIITDWLNEGSHRNEVIGIRFENTQMAGEFSKFISVFDKHGWFSSSSSKVRVNDDGEWPTLRDAINKNKRIFIFVNPDLCNYSCRNSKRWVHSNTKFDDTYKYRKVSSSCSGVVADTRDACKGTADFSLLSIFASVGLCISDMQGYCNSWINEATLACYAEREKNGLTANWVCADYVGRAGNNENVVSIARTINYKNIARFRK